MHVANIDNIPEHAHFGKGLEVKNSIASTMMIANEKHVIVQIK